METKKPNTEQPKPRETRSYGATLHDNSGATMRVVGKKRPDGSFRVQLRHIVRGADGKKVVKRGATEQVADLAAATKRVEELAAVLVKEGWTRGAIRAPFASKADEFTLTSLPKPNSVKSYPKPAPAAVPAGKPAKK